MMRKKLVALLLALCLAASSVLPALAAAPAPEVPATVQPTAQPEESADPATVPPTAQNEAQPTELPAPTQQPAPEQQPTETAAPTPQPDIAPAALTDSTEGDFTSVEGNQMHWSFADGVLTITGQGAIPDYRQPSFYYENEIDYAPWYDYREDVKSLILSDGITALGSGDFAHFGSLADITFSKDIVTIGWNAFYQCDALKQIELPTSLETIGHMAFADCKSLASIKFNDHLKEIESSFEGCTSLTELDLPEGLEEISSAFEDCTRLTRVYLPDSIDGMDYAFSGCTSLTQVNLPRNPGVLMYHAFKDCISLQEISLPIEYAWFGYTDAFIDGVGPLFDGCTNLKTIYLPPNINSLSEQIYNGTGVQHVELPGSLYEVGAVFINAEKLENVILPNNEDATSLLKYEKLVPHLFKGCTALRWVYIPATVNTIGSGAFSGCSSLHDIYFGGTQEQWDAITIDQTDNEALQGATIHYGYTPEMLYDKIVELYLVKTSPACGKKYFGDDLTLTFNRPLHGLRLLDENNQPLKLEIHEYATDSLVVSYSLDNGLGSDPDLSVVFSYTSVTFKNLLHKLKSGSKYYVTIDPGMIQAKQTTDDGQIVTFAGISNKDALWFDRNAFTTRAPFQTDPEDPPTFNYYGAFGTGKLGQYTYEYDDRWFEADSTTYQHDLARMSLRMAMAAFSDGSIDELVASKNIRDLMQAIGLENIKTDYPIPRTDSIGSIIGAKNIQDGDKQFSLITVAIRGGGYGREWGGNFRVGETSQDHLGWTLAKSEVLKRLDDYLAEYKDDLFPEIKVWIMGYSRGSAVANLVAKELDNGLEYYDYKIDQEDVFAYGFEVPQTTDNPDRSDSNYDNIFNIANPIDIVTKVVMDGSLGFGRYGKTLFLPYHGGNANYKELRKKMCTELDKIAAMCGDPAFSDLVGEGPVQARKFDDLMSYLSFCFHTRERYVFTVQDALVGIMDKIMSSYKTWSDLDAVALFSDIFTGIPFLSLVIVDQGYTLGECAACLKEGGFSFHYPELCMAWLDSLDAKSFDKFSKRYRVVYINCPVDVTVRDTSDTVKQQITDHTVQPMDNETGAYIDDDGQIVLVLPADMQYTIDIIATDTGTVTYTATEYSLEKQGTARVVSYQQVNVIEGDTLQGTVEDLTEPGPAHYPLTKNSESVPVTLDQNEDNGDTVEMFGVTVTAQEGGTVTGGNGYLNGEYAQVTAEAEQGWLFDGWYQGDTLVSAEPEYRFLVRAETELTAHFRKAPSTEPQQPQQPAGPAAVQTVAQGGIPKTADGQHPLLWCLLLAASGTGMVALVLVRRKRR